jgi:hypothetical protein
MSKRSFVARARGRLGATVRWSQRLNAWEEARLDRRLGVDTRGRLELPGLDVRGDATQGHPYVATQPRLARWILGGLPPERGEYTFVDLGSGKGRMLIYAARAGFRRAIGVEFAAELHATAARNASVLTSRGLEIEPLLVDARAYEFPDEPLVVYFNNPFAEPVMQSVLENLAASYGRRPRPLVVVYQQMTHEQPGHATRNLELLDSVEFLTPHRLPRPSGRLDRRMVSQFTVWIYESAEIATPAGR